MKTWLTIAAALFVAAPVLADDPRPGTDAAPPSASAPSTDSPEVAPESADGKNGAEEDGDGESAPAPPASPEAKTNDEGKGSDQVSKETEESVAETLEKLFGTQRFPRFQKNSDAVRDVFKAPIQSVRKSTAAIVSDDELVSLGAIVDADGLIVTKASELKGDIVCRLDDGKEYAARIVATDAASDVAMLKIEASGLPAVQWAEGVPEVGTWVATAGLFERPLALGVVSVAPRDLPAPHAVLGVFLDEDPAGVRINRVLPESGAEEAGVLVNDVVQAVNGEGVKNREELISRVKQFRAGDRLLLKIKRGDETLLLGAVLKNAAEFDPDDRKEFQNSLGGRLSERRGGFSGVLQHDTVLKPEHCGGPICDLDGKVVGINICRAGRVESYALTSTAVRDLLAAMKAGERSTSAADGVRKAQVEKLLGMVEEHLKTLEGDRALRQAALDAAKKSLEEAEKALTDSESAATPVQADVDAAKKRVEEAKASVKTAEKSTKSVDSALQATKREEETLKSELGRLTRS